MQLELDPLRNHWFGRSRPANPPALQLLTCTIITAEAENSHWPKSSQVHPSPLLMMPSLAEKDFCSPCSSTWLSPVYEVKPAISNGQRDEQGNQILPKYHGNGAQRFTINTVAWQYFMMIYIDIWWFMIHDWPLAASWRALERWNMLKHWYQVAT